MTRCRIWDAAVPARNAATAVVMAVEIDCTHVGLIVVAVVWTVYPNPPHRPVRFSQVTSSRLIPPLTPIPVVVPFWDDRNDTSSSLSAAGVILPGVAEETPSSTLPI